MIIWLHRALIWVFKTASKVEEKISVHHCLLLHAQQRYVISYFIDIQLLSKQKLLFYFNILVPRASVSFGHVVGETEGSGSSHYRMSENHGHPVTHAYFLPTYLLMLRN